MLRFVSLMGCAATFAFAQLAVLPTTLKIKDETVPPGGMVQLKVLLTSPQPILQGRFGLFADGLAGVSLFSPNGDASGTAVLDNSNLTVRMVSPSQSIGTNPDYPIMTVTRKIPANAVVGTVSTIQLASLDLGINIPLELKPGTLTIGGSISVTDVIPGGGLVHAGETIRVLGVGFSPKTKIRLKNSVVTSAVFVSSNEIDLVPTDDVQLEGTLVRAENPDNSSSFYYSYMRGIPDGESSQPFLKSVEPIFATNTFQEAFFPAQSIQADGGSFMALALQNPGSLPAQVTLEAYSGTTRLKSEPPFMLDARHRIIRDPTELIAVGATYWRIASSSPIQVLGIRCDSTTKTAVPIPPFSSVPAAAVRP
jgi:hypothetical protein